MSIAVARYGMLGEVIVLPSCFGCSHHQRQYPLAILIANKLAKLCSKWNWGRRSEMALGKLLLIVLFMLSLSITFTESQANESMLFFTDFHSISPSPTPQQQDGLNSSPVEIFLLPITSSINQHLPTSSQSSNFVTLQSSSNSISSLSSRAGSSLSILPSKSSSILLSISMSVQAKTTLVSSEIMVVSMSLPILVPSSTPIIMTPPVSSIMTTSLSRVAPSTMFISSPVDSSTSPSLNIEATTTVDGIPTPSSSDINSISSIVMTGSDLAFDSTSIRTLTKSSIIRSTTMEIISVSSILLSPTVMAITSSPVSMETTLITILLTTTEDVIEESTVTKEEEELITRSTSTAGISTPAVIGMVVAACLVLIATALLILVLCYCFRRSRKYEYRTGNEYRVTVQKWNAHYAHYTANQCESVSSSRGSSIMSSFGFRSSNGKMKPHYGGVSSSTDHIHTGATAEMYSTPL